MDGRMEARTHARPHAGSISISCCSLARPTSGGQGRECAPQQLISVSVEREREKEKRESLSSVVALSLRLSFALRSLLVLRRLLRPRTCTPAVPASVSSPSRPHARDSNSNSNASSTPHRLQKKRKRKTPPQQPPAKEKGKAKGGGREKKETALATKLPDSGRPY